MTDMVKKKDFYFRSSSNSMDKINTWSWDLAETAMWEASYPARALAAICCRPRLERNRVRVPVALDGYRFGVCVCVCQSFSSFPFYVR